MKRTVQSEFLLTMLAAHPLPSVLDLVMLCTTICWLMHRLLVYASELSDSFVYAYFFIIVYPHDSDAVEAKANVVSEQLMQPLSSSDEEDRAK